LTQQKGGDKKDGKGDKKDGKGKNKFPKICEEFELKSIYFHKQERSN
jgi:hypothetical protein